MSRIQIYHNFSLFNGITPEVQPNCWMEITNGHIQHIGTGKPRSSGEFSKTSDLSGLTVIPGMIDAHVHLIVPFAPGINLAVLRSLYWQIRLNLYNCIRSGVTTVRDVGAPPGLIRRIINWVKEGKAIGPRIIRTNSFIIPPGATPEQVPTFPLPLRLFLGG